MSLEELRKRIDEIDEQLVNLLNERAGVVIEIGKLPNGAPVPPPRGDSPDEVREIHLSSF